MSKVFLTAILILALSTVFIIHTREISSGYVACYDDVRSKVIFNEKKALDKEWLNGEDKDYIKIEFCGNSYNILNTYKNCTESIKEDNPDIPQAVFDASYYLGKAMRPPMKSYTEFAMLHNDACAPLTTLDL